jgi:hypothetical protein
MESSAAGRSMPGRGTYKAKRVNTSSNRNDDQLIYLQYPTVKTTVRKLFNVEIVSTFET